MWIIINKNRCTKSLPNIKFKKWEPKEIILDDTINIASYNDITNIIPNIYLITHTLYYYV